MIKLHLDTQHLDLDSDLKEYLEGRIKDIWFSYTKIPSEFGQYMVENKDAKANITISGLEFTYEAWEMARGTADNLIGDMHALQDEINKPNWEQETHKMLREEAKQDYINSYEP